MAHYDSSRGYCSECGSQSNEHHYKCSRGKMRVDDPATIGSVDFRPSGNTIIHDDPLNVNEVQIGGDHYRKGGENQHWDFVEDNGLGYLEGNVTKYATRWRHKNGVQDLEKAIHYLDKLRQKIGQRFRLPRGHAGEDAVHAFAVANELTWSETFLVEILSTWTCEADLIRASQLLDGMVEEPERHTP